MISPIKPRLFDGYVLLGDVRLIFDKNRYEVLFGEETFDTRLISEKDRTRTAYYIDFVPLDGLTDKFLAEIKISEK